MSTPIKPPNFSSEDKARRTFLRNVLSGAAGATVLMVYGPGASLFNEAQASPNFRPGLADPGGPANKYAYVIDVRKCIGCGACVRACKRENNVPADVFRTWVERYILTGEGIYIDSPNGGHDAFESVNAELAGQATDAWFTPKMCNHCDHPPCVQVCPVGATFKTDDGFVLVDADHCLGCGYCVQACPYGARFINPEEHKSDKCTWCYHRVKNDKKPACVEVCPQKVRLFGDLKDPQSEVTKIFKENQWMVLKPDMYTNPTCFYVGLPKEVV